MYSKNSSVMDLSGTNWLRTNTREMILCILAMSLTGVSVVLLPMHQWNFKAIRWFEIFGLASYLILKRAPGIHHQNADSVTCQRKEDIEYSPTSSFCIFIIRIFSSSMKINFTDNSFKALSGVIIRNHGPEYILKSIICTISKSSKYYSVCQRGPIMSILAYSRI